MFFSGAFAAAELLGDPERRRRSFMSRGPRLPRRSSRADRQPPPSPTASIGNLSRPYFPDGEVGRPPGPFSRPIAEFNPFSTGLQSALIVGNVGQHLGFVLGAQPPTRRSAAPPFPMRPGRNRCRTASRSSPARCRSIAAAAGRRDRRLGRRHRPGRHDQLPRPAQWRRCGSAASAMPPPRSAPTRSSSRSGGSGVRLRYVSCPFAPFLDTNEQNVCQGK